MKKIIVTMMLILTMGLMTGCGNSTDTKTSKPFTQDDAVKLGKELSDSGVFDDTVSEVSAQIAAQYLNLKDSDYSSIISYKGTGGSAQEINIIELKDGINIDSNVEGYLKEQEDTFASYNAKEVNYIKNAIKTQKGNFYILVVATDYDKASSIINK